jgi:hypothetical protein
MREEEKGERYGGCGKEVRGEWLKVERIGGAISRLDLPINDDSCERFNYGLGRLPFTSNYLLIDTIYQFRSSRFTTNSHST